ncbi:NAD(P)-dependent oxidoreductase [Paractinoplanes maris]|uniref:NAD(P)-dependent oxidoreductase n=1 Tax=Paractinoplanes maris TaxID=1734446 RepID=UPI0020201336|nr:NAD(P)-dependent oxidoreductase [Actinoplanes maris]
MAMLTVGLVSAGFMGSGLGAALLGGGARVVTTLEGRSARTARLTAEAGLEVLATLGDVVAAADVLLSVTPPGAVLDTARAIAKHTAGRRGLIVADLNAVSPWTMTTVAAVLAETRFVDGSISGPPPSVRPGARLYLSGADAAAVAGLPWNGQVEPIVLGNEIGAASALKMCTGSVYKGLTALVTQAMRTAGAHGVLDAVLADLDRNGLADSDGVARSATKAHRFVDEMREVAATQEAAGLTAELFIAISRVYADIARTPLAEAAPENDRDLTPAEIVARLRSSPA